MFVNNGDTPHFSMEELKLIYEKAKAKTAQAIKDAAQELFPERTDIALNNLYLSDGPGRAFMHNGAYENPRFLLVSYPVMTGVMKDGTIYLF